VLYDGLAVLGGGSTLGGLVLGAIAVFVIDRKLVKAGGFALAGGILTFFGLMHGEHIGLAESPAVAFGYLAVAVVLILCAVFAKLPAGPDEHPGESPP
jgi:AGZA family xanthine/uracil permease-like MFS transporter